jgi:acetyltransferase-like isoleucine patch superfamily enzyme
MLLRDKLDFFMSFPQKELPLSNSKIETFSVILGTPKSLRFEPHCSIQSQIIGQGFVFFGSHSYINGGGYIRSDEGGVFIGRYCSIGRRVSISAGQHKMSCLSTSPSVKGTKARPYTDNEKISIKIDQIKKKTVIGNDVWIGDGAVILSGVNIGHGAVIAANAVVTKDVEDYGIYAGIPARKINSRFSQEIISELICSEWWESDINYLNSLPTKNIFEFLSLFNKSYCKVDTFAV